MVGQSFQLLSVSTKEDSLSGYEVYQCHSILKSACMWYMDNFVTECTCLMSLLIYSSFAVTLQVLRTSVTYSVQKSLFYQHKRITS